MASESNKFVSLAQQNLIWHDKSETLHVKSNRVGLALARHLSQRQTYSVWVDPNRQLGSSWQEHGIWTRPKCYAYKQTVVVYRSNSLPPLKSCFKQIQKITSDMKLLPTEYQICLTFGGSSQVTEIAITSPHTHEHNLWAIMILSCSLLAWNITICTHQQLPQNNYCVQDLVYSICFVHSFNFSILHSYHCCQYNFSGRQQKIHCNLYMYVYKFIIKPKIPLFMLCMYCWKMTLNFYTLQITFTPAVNDCNQNIIMVIKLQ